MMISPTNLLATSPLTQLIIYILLAFAFTWALHLQIVRKRLSIKEGQGRALYWLGLPGPTLAAVAVASASGSTNQLAQSMLHWPIGIQWWLLAIFAIPTVYLVATGIHSWRLIGKPTSIFRRPKEGWLALFMSQLVVVSSEEVGWRGFALPLLIGIFGSVGGTVVLGLGWALWHLPMFRVPTSHQRGAFWRFVYSLITWSTIMTVLVTGSGGSILPAMAFHAAANISYFIMDVPPEAERYTTLLLGLASLFLIRLLPSPLITINP